MQFAPATPGAVDWSILVLEPGVAEPLLALGEDRVLKTASVAKVLLLVEVAARVTEGTLDPDEPLRRTEPVGGSGLWQSLRSQTLPAGDVAALVGSVSDNLATNTLLDRIGLDAVAERARSLGCADSALLDRVRDQRGPEHPPTVSLGTAAEWVHVLGQLHDGRAAGPGADRMVLNWLSATCDLSMVAGAFRLDHLSHRNTGHLRLAGKTGTDTGVRADIGILAGRRTLAWACIANWDEAAAPGLAETVQEDMRLLGAMIAAHNLA